MQNFLKKPVNFKLFYRDICDLEIVSEEDVDFVKAKLSI